MSPTLSVTLIVSCILEKHSLYSKDAQHDLTSAGSQWPSGGLGIAFGVLKFAQGPFPMHQWDFNYRGLLPRVYHCSVFLKGYRLCAYLKQVPLPLLI